MPETPLTKSKFHVDCLGCRYSGEIGETGFQVDVHVEDLKTGSHTTAVLECEVGQERHSVRLKNLTDDEGNEMRLDNSERQQLDKILDRIADKKLCGNSDICPGEVVERVRSSGPDSGAQKD